MELLPDPLCDRKVRELKPPPNRKLTISMVVNESKIDMMVLKEHLIAEGQLDKSLLLYLINEVQTIMLREPNLVKIEGDVSIIGDIHGQFYDLTHIYEKLKKPPKMQYLFLGDYVDRGIYSVEVLVFLFALKINYPKHVIMLRGNHECRTMTEFFTFRDECLKKFDQEIYDQFNEAFDLMPIAAIVNNDYFCMHGGVSPHLNKIDDVNDIDRCVEPPIEGALCDLLWSDPIDDIYANSTEYKENQERECSYYFGNSPVKELLRDRGLVSVIRAHQVQLEGYKMHRWNGMSNFPSVITVFSAPNYCGTYSNSGAVAIVKSSKLQIKQFSHTPTPFHLPGDLDLFEYSIPFIAEKVVGMLYSLVSTCSDYNPQAYELENIDLSKLDSEGKDKHQRMEILKTKIKSVARCAKLFRTLKDNNEMLLDIKQMSQDGKIPRGLLMQGRPAIKDIFKEYLLAKDLDCFNEKRPGIGYSQSSNDSLLI